MTKFQIAVQIEKVARELGRDPWGASRMMTIMYDHFTKAELEQKLSDLENELIIKRHVSNEKSNAII